MKATDVTTPGMVRIFLKNPNGNFYLLEEFQVYATVPDQSYGVLETYQGALVFPMGNFKLATEWELYASTQKDEPFNVIAEGYTQEYCGC